MADNNLKITGITLKNFLSVGNAAQALKLDDHGLSLVLGNNSDSNGGTTKNGAGKTTILQALSFGLYGQPLTKIKVDNLINNINGKNMHVVIDFEKAGTKYRIERGRKPSIMKFYIDGKNSADNNEAKGENSETQNDINDIIGMSHTMFTHIVALNTYTDPFLKLGAGKQREIIEELLGVTQISARAERLKALIGVSKDEIKTFEANISATKAANNRILSSISSAKENASKWLKKHQETIKLIEQELRAIQDIDFESELSKFDSLDEYNKFFNQYTSDLKILDSNLLQIDREINSLLGEKARYERDLNGNGSAASAARLEKEIERNNTAILNMQSALEKELAQVAHFEELLEHPDDQNCKTCGQQLTGTDHLQYVIKRFNEERDGHNEKAMRLKTDIKNLQNDIEALEKDRTNLLIEAENKKTQATLEIKRIDDLIGNLKIELEAKTAEKNEIRGKLESLGNKPQTLFPSRDEVYVIKHAKDTLVADLERENTAINPFDSQIEGFEAALQTIDMEPLNIAHDTLRHQEFLFKLLTSKDSFIRRKIIEQNLAFLNNRLNQYLNKLGLPHEVVFQSDLSVEITLLGRDFDFAQLSRGESNRVIMATSWAFRDVWESLNNRVNILWVDEMIDSGLDSNGAEAALQILKSFSRAGRNVYLISHRDELIGRIDRTLLVSKVNGFTSISEQE